MAQPRDFYVSSAQAEWTSRGIPSISVKVLRRDAKTGALCSLLRFELKPGDYLYAPRGCIHAASSSGSGADSRPGMTTIILQES